MTYGDVTQDSQKTAYVILDKFNVDQKVTYKFDSNIRSSWPNKDAVSEVFDDLDEEHSSISALSDDQLRFRVMQAVATTQISVLGVL